MHFHPRTGSVQQTVIGHTARVFARGIVMPNPTPTEPILTAKDVRLRRAELVRNTQGTGFTPLMTIKLTRDTTPQIIDGAVEEGVVAAKGFPDIIEIVKSYGGWESRFVVPDETFGRMEEVGLPFSWHCELPPDAGEKLGIPFTQREVECLALTEAAIYSRFPRLRIIVEHLSTAEAVRWVGNKLGETVEVNGVALPRVAGTLAIPHLFLTIDDVGGAKLHPHLFCKPTPRFYEDLSSIRAAAVSGLPCWSLGTDSAPWTRWRKECPEGNAGLFSAPVALPALAGLFEQAGRLDRLEDFVAKFGADFYGLPYNEGKITLVKDPEQPMKVRREYGGIVPYLAGEFLPWRIAGTTSN
jgi:dihydroorotase